MQRTSWFAYLCQVQDTKGSKQIKKKYAQFGNAVASCVDEWLSHMTHHLFSARCAPTDTMTLLQLWLHFNAEFFPWVTSLTGTFLPETVMAKPSKVNQDLIKIGPIVILTPVCALWKQSAGFQPADWAAPSSSLSSEGGSLTRQCHSGLSSLCHVTSWDALSVCTLTVHLQIKRPSGCKHWLNSLNRRIYVCSTFQFTALIQQVFKSFLTC